MSTNSASQPTRVAGQSSQAATQTLQTVTRSTQTPTQTNSNTSQPTQSDSPTDNDDGTAANPETPPSHWGPVDDSMMIPTGGVSPFSSPKTGQTVTIGEPFNLAWDPSQVGVNTSTSVSLYLGLEYDAEIAFNFSLIDASVENNGRYTWTPAENIAPGSTYVIKSFALKQDTHGRDVQIVDLSPVFSIKRVGSAGFRHSPSVSLAGAISIVVALISFVL